VHGQSSWPNHAAKFSIAFSPSFHTLSNQELNK